MKHFLLNHPYKELDLPHKQQKEELVFHNEYHLIGFGENRHEKRQQTKITPSQSTTRAHTPVLEFRAQNGKNGHELGGCTFDYTIPQMKGFSS